MLLIPALGTGEWRARIQHGEWLAGLQACREGSGGYKRLDTLTILLVSCREGG